LHGDAVERVGVEHYAQWIAGEAPLGEDIECCEGAYRAPVISAACAWSLTTRAQRAA
jgi:hypothetical protein